MRQPPRREPELLLADIAAAAEDSAVDRDWFRAHPDRTIYLRLATPAETRLDKKITATLVEQIRPGVRMRFYAPALLPVPTNATERDCRRLLRKSCREIREQLLRSYRT